MNRQNWYTTSSQDSQDWLKTRPKKSKDNQVAALLSKTEGRPHSIMLSEEEKKELEKIFDAYFFQGIRGSLEYRGCSVYKKELWNTFLEFATFLYREYAHIDRVHWLRRDGSTNWSHAKEVLELSQYGKVHSIVDLFWLLGHDALEDILSPGSWKWYTEEQRIQLIERRIEAILAPLRNPSLTKNIFDYIRSLTKERVVQAIDEPDDLYKIRKSQQKYEKDSIYNERIIRLSDREFIGKCYDRLHALLTFDKNKLSMVSAKLDETEYYLLPEIQLRLAGLDGVIREEKYIQTYNYLLLLLGARLSVCRKTCNFLMGAGETHYSKKVEWQLFEPYAVPMLWDEV